MDKREASKYIFNLLNNVKPCTCNTVLQYRADVTLENGDRHDDFLIGEIDVNSLGNVQYCHSDGGIIDMDNLSLVCEDCKADWTAWNCLLDKRYHQALTWLNK